MYAVYKEMQPKRIHPTKGECIYEFDSLYWFEANAKARCDEISADLGAYGYYEEVLFSDPTIDGRLVPLDK